MNNGAVAGSIIALVCLVFLSAFFSCSETAFTSFNEIRMETLARNKKRARACLSLSKNYDTLLSTILIGNNIVNIAAATIATVLFTNFYKDMGPTIATIVITLVVLIFGEITPKSLAKEHPEGFAMFVVFPLYGLYYLLYPITFIFHLLQVGIRKLVHFKPKEKMTDEELRMFVEDIHEEGVLNELEHDIIQNTIDYGDTQVKEIMKTKKEVVFVSIKDSNERILKVFMDSNFSRIPISRTKSINDCFGIIHQRDFYEMLITKQGTLESIVREVIEVKPTKKISRLLKMFQKEKQHFAFVKQDGKFVGIITMENILEELVGDIDDEFDDEIEK